MAFREMEVGTIARRYVGVAKTTCDSIGSSSSAAELRYGAAYALDGYRGPCHEGVAPPTIHASPRVSQPATAYAVIENVAITVHTSDNS